MSSIQIDTHATAIRWTGDHAGYHYGDYFRAGQYLGADAAGVEPIFPASVTRDEDGVYIAECPALPGCVSQGTTHDAALDHLRDAIAACIDDVAQ